MKQTWKLMGVVWITHDRIIRCAEAMGNLRCEFVQVRLSAAYFPQRICVHCGRCQEKFAARWKERVGVNR